MWLSILIADLSTGEQDFVVKLYMEYGDFMFYEALKILKNEHDAQDAVQDAFVKIIKYLTKFSGNSDNEIRNKIVIGIRGAIQNKAIDHYNEKKERLLHETSPYFKSEEDGEYHTKDIPDVLMDIEDIAVTKETQAIVRKAILQLTPTLQDAVNLVYISGFTSVEAADYLGVSDNTIRQRLYAARQIIREMLGDEFGERNKK